MVLLSLMAALAGTPLRLVEAAHDLAGTIAELDGVSVIEVTDGGVGDDSDSTIQAKSSQVSTLISVVDLLPPESWVVLSPSRPLLLRAEDSTSISQTLPRRLARLQCFLC